LFRRTGETVSEFSGPVGDMDLDGIQAAVLHPQAELFVNFLDPVLLEAIAHASASARDGHIAMLIAGYFGSHRMFHQRLKPSRGRRICPVSSEPEQREFHAFFTKQAFRPMTMPVHLAGDFATDIQQADGLELRSSFDPPLICNGLVLRYPCH
jgi:hypothetical protein